MRRKEKKQTKREGRESDRLYLVEITIQTFYLFQV